MKFRSRIQAEVVAQAVGNSAVPFLAQGSEYPAGQFFFFILPDELSKAGKRLFYRRDDVAGEEFGQIMKESTQEFRRKSYFL
jgi:hypothetical protein